MEEKKERKKHKICVDCERELDLESESSFCDDCLEKEVGCLKKLSRNIKRIVLVVKTGLKLAKDC